MGKFWLFSEIHVFWYRWYFGVFVFSWNVSSSPIGLADIVDLSYWSVWRGSFAIGQSAIKHSASDTILAIQNHVGVLCFPISFRLAVSPSRFPSATRSWSFKGRGIVGRRALFTLFGNAFLDMATAGHTELRLWRPLFILEGSYLLKSFLDHSQRITPCHIIAHTSASSPLLLVENPKLIYLLWLYRKVECGWPRGVGKVVISHSCVTIYRRCKCGNDAAGRTNFPLNTGSSVPDALVFFVVFLSSFRSVLCPLLNHQKSLWLHYII